jgi:predicted TIM-barrel fold metal-dependent hydrolase
MTHTGYDLISADSHVIEPGDLFETRLPAALRDRAPNLSSWEGGSAWMVDGADPVPLPESAATGSSYRPRGGCEDKAAINFEDVMPALYDPAERIKAQEADSVDAEIIYPYPGLWDAIKQLEDSQLKLACVRAYNDWVAEFSSYCPDRLLGLGKIPSTNVDDAREELRRCVEELNLRGVILEAWPAVGTPPGDPVNDQFWDAVNEAGVPVSIHYALGLESVTTPQSGVAPGLRPPMADAALPMVAAGVFDRFPNLKLVFAHGDAGWSLHWLEFTDINFVRQRHLNQYALQDPEALPSEYIRRHFWFTFHQDRTSVRNRDQFDTAHLLWSSNFPLDATDWPDNRQQAVRVTEGLPAQARRALLAENTARLYRLPGYEDGFAPASLSSFPRLVHF